LKQQTSITVYRLPTKENKLRFSFAENKRGRKTNGNFAENKRNVAFSGQNGLAHLWL
jgi:hypothetical protein